MVAPRSFVAICPCNGAGQGTRPVEATDSVPNVGTAAYDEWVLDEALQETFPASDPALPTRPGSSLGLRTPGGPKEPTS